MEIDVRLSRGEAACLRTLREAGYEAYPVGGCVRDWLLGREPGDVDVCTSAKPEKVLNLFPHAIPTGLQHGTVTVVTEGEKEENRENIEVTTFRRETGYADGRHPDGVIFDAGLEEDLGRRDFTINALALRPDGTVVDLFGGLTDLQNKVIRCVGDPDRRFAEDALRMLRAVRFAAQLDFQLDPETAKALDRNAHRIVHVSGERIRVEMEKTLLSGQPEKIGLMIDAGLLDHLHTFHRGVDLSALKQTEAVPEIRWRAFCQKTGFPISALPVERRLKRAVEHPELDLIPTLALSGRDLMALGLTGPDISGAQKKLALHILDHPEDNTRERLLSVLKKNGSL